jgi:hypothetical protein
MIPPLTFAEALKAARKAKALRFVWRGATFDLSEAVAPRDAKESTTLSPLEAWRAKRARQA